jgi:hypothetical protein
LIQVFETTTADREARLAAFLANDLVNIKVVGNGNKVLKDGLSAMFKQVMKINARKPSTGLYTLFFSDPKIGEAKPLPSWIFTSLNLIITDNAPASGAFHDIDIIVTESAYEQQDLTGWRVLVEKYLDHKTYGTFTGWQKYEHERAYKVYGYVYEMDDNDTDSATIFNGLKLLGRKPEGELTVCDVPMLLLIAENNSEIGIDTLDTGFYYLEWLRGFPTHEFASLYSYNYIKTAGTNAGLRVLERYVL